jgi:hypothetical protein
VTLPAYMLTQDWGGIAEQGRNKLVCSLPSSLLLKEHFYMGLHECAAQSCGPWALPILQGIRKLCALLASDKNREVPPFSFVSAML